MFNTTLTLGIIVGPSKTYGKGLVQKITPLPFDNALKYTIAKYYTPSGRCIQSVTYTGMSVRTSFLFCLIPNRIFSFCLYAALLWEKILLFSF